MKRRKFMAASSLLGMGAVAPALAAQSVKKNDKEVYELRTYETKMGGMGRLEAYIQTALMPALNRMGASKVGVFKEMSKDDPAKLHVLIAYSKQEQYFTIHSQLKTDADYLKAADTYLQTPPDKATFDRMSSSLMVAFDGMPKLATPSKEPRIMELRTYESYNEDAARRKIKMFNDGEIAVFNKVKLNIVFFGEVLIGPRMPCLTYMLTFKNMEERNANWAQFSADPDWKQLSGAPEYANTVSRIARVFLEPTAYSQI
ncbi:NIPSNAP family protein [Runella slithyformis]|uniref:NIPSNAP family containing protein n=1 Tax=Runella slithyformis (strain ATCC 29530 / DSM 19594 / LMG 11500 / NCIMB 11436 / LSU 4) TaxID=761193 RepID=A0A7U4E6G9_RUNSL|nr:NIPSNAP family protein [Runella slithyformis]AEI49199.1 NIPSNAP family containing protein [Runella slithyformis DSM 19594]